MQIEAVHQFAGQLRRARWNAAEASQLRNAVNILNVAPLRADERQLTLLDAFSEFLHLVQQPARLIFAGDNADPDYQQRIEQRIGELKLHDRVVMAGNMPQATRLALYRHADVLVSLHTGKELTTSLIEAMLFDVPVLADATGEVLPLPGDTQAIAASLQLLLSEPALRRRVLAAQRQRLQSFLPPGFAKSKPYWQIEGPFDSSYSLAIVNRELARALARRGNDIGLRSMEGSGDFTPSAIFLDANPDCAALVQRAQEVVLAPDVALRFCYPPHVDDMPAAARVIHSYGWEETGFPAEYVAAFNRKLDLVTVLSNEVAKILRDNGVRIPIAVTGGGVDHLLAVEPQAPAVEMRAFRFLHISSCFPRKGVDALLSAYGKAFRNDDDVSLVIKTFPNPHNDVGYRLERLRALDPEYPHVVLIDRDCSPEEVAGWYRACHAFVAPSRGEGLGLPMAEAMLFDLPVIATAWGGQRDFCDESTAWLCDYLFAKSETHFGQTHSVWADPDIDHLASLLREVHGLAPEQRSARTSAARQRILRDFTWDRVAERTEAALHALVRQPVFRKEPRIGWLSTWNKRCGIASYSSFLSVAIPEDRMVVFADHTPDRTAEDGENVIRCWEIDPDETLDEAFDAIVAQKVDTVVIQYNFGFFAPRVLGGLIERLKAAGIGVHCFFHATGDLVLIDRRISLSDIADALRLADRLYVHSVLDLNRLKKLGLVNNVTFFPQGVLPAASGESENERAQLGLQGKKIIAAYGFLLPHKGLQELIEAFAQLADDESLHLLMVNSLYPVPVSEQERDACVALIERLGLTQRVTMITDFLPEERCIALLRMAELTVYPYQRTQESSSAAARMGLATGRPVAVTPLSIFDDIGDAVHVLPDTDVDSIAQGIRKLLDNPDAVARQMEKTRQWLTSRQWPALSVRLLNLIDGLANPLQD
jgi:glycosyltransferase involved in cell wall biosynthesis